MNFKRFRFVCPGEVWVGVVRGKYGEPVRKIKQLHDDQRAVVSGRSIKHSYEPKPGHVEVYCEFATHDDKGPPDVIDLSRPDLKIMELN